MKKLLSILLVLHLHVQPASTQSRTLTIEEALATGLENSRMLHASLMKSAYAEARSSEVSAGLYPSVKAQLGYQKLSEVPVLTIPIPPTPVSFPSILDNYAVRATVQQPLFTGWRLHSAAESADHSAQAAHSDYESDRQDLLYQIKSAYWNLYRAKEVKLVTDENVTQMAEHLRDVQNMLDQGLATRNEVLKTNVQLVNARVMQSDAENGVRLATITLNSIIGIPLSTSVDIGSSLSADTQESPEADRLVSAALNDRADVQGLVSRMHAAETGITAARGGWLPQIYLTGSYYYSRPNPRIFPAKDEFRDTWDLGVSLQFDVWNNLTTVYQVTEARAQFEQAKDALSMLRDGVTLDVTQSCLAVKQGAHRIELARLGVDQATENIRVTKEKFKAGLTTNSELIDAEVSQVQAKVQLVQSLVDYQIALAKLDRSVGKGR